MGHHGWNRDLLEMLITIVTTIVVLLCSESHIKTSILVKTKKIKNSTQFLLTSLFYLILFVLEGLVGSLLLHIFDKDFMKILCFSFFGSVAFYSLINSVTSSNSTTVRKLVFNASFTKFTGETRSDSLIDKDSIVTIEESVEEYGPEPETSEVLMNNIRNKKSSSSNKLGRISSSTSKNMDEHELILDIKAISNERKFEENNLRPLVISPKFNHQTSRGSSENQEFGEKDTSVEYEFLYVLFLLIARSELFTINFFVLAFYSTLLEDTDFLIGSFFAMLIFFSSIIFSGGKLDSSCYLKVKHILLGFIMILCSSYAYYK